MSQLALYLFGPPRLEMDGNPIHIPRRKALALLAYLAFNSQSHSRDSLAALLWPENDQSSARAELRRTLSVLNRKLGEGWLTADREIARLNTNNDLATGKSYWLDVAVFQGKLKICEAHNHPPTVTCPDCLPKLEAAVELYQDDFMVGFSLKDCPAYDEWQFFQREELRASLTNALVRLSSHYANALEYEVAISHARRWLALDPLHEPAHRQLISLFSQSGQRAAALRQYENCRQILSDELGVEPSDETRELYQKIRTSTLISLSDARLKSNLPAQATPFIGRVNELAEIRAKLAQDDCRLLTLLGPGGSGKTRLAIEAAGRLLDDFKHGGFFVNLAPLEDAERIPTAIAGALNFSFYEQGSPEEQLLDYLGNKQILLILDNFEHLLAGVSLVSKILNEAPGVKILATSRTRLMVTGEHLFDVWGMAYPESPVPVEIASNQFSAIKLFESEASRVQADFKLNEDSLQDVIQVCSLLEGMPLGIVLAASWVKMLTPAEIAVEIARNLTFLEKELRDLPRRQRGMRSVFNHSWRLLSSHEQDLMGALSFFRGGFTREAAQKIAGTSLADLMGLIDQSMLHRAANGRFEMHELLRQYAAEKLAEDSVIEADTRRKHSDYYCQALAVWERSLQGLQQVTARDEMVLEIDNIRAAWAVEKTKIKTLLDALNGLCLFHYVHNQFIEGEATCRSLGEKLNTEGASDQSKTDFLDEDNTNQVDTLKLQARALSWGALLNANLGNRELAWKLVDECLSLLERSELAGQDTRFEKAVAYLTSPWVIKNTQKREKKERADEAVQLFRSLDELWWVGLALMFLGAFASSRDEKISYREESLAVRRKLGDLKGTADSLANLSSLAGFGWQFEKAEALAYEALEIYRDLDDQHQIAIASGRLGGFWVWQGKFNEARSLERETLETFHELRYTQSRVAWLHVCAGFPDQYLGEYEAARNQARHAIQLLEEVKQYYAPYWTALGIDILGRVALAEGSYSEAQDWFQECLPVYQAHNNPENIGQALACQGFAVRGFAVRGLNQISQAKAYLCRALRVAIKAESYLSLFHTLPGIALLFADQGETERAVELYALASTQGIVANSKWFDDIAGGEIAAVAEELSEDVAEAAKTRGRGLDLWETAAQLLVELDEKGWDGAVRSESTE